MPTVVGMPLPDPFAQRISDIRAELVDRFGVDEYVNPFPHFTLYALDEGADVAAIERALTEVVVDHDPLKVHTDGIGVFPGNVVWLPVAKSPALTALQSDVADAIDHLGTRPVPYYQPHRWFPHVGFALDLEDEQTSDVVEYLLPCDLEWDVTVDSITVTRPPEDETRYEAVVAVEL